MSSKLASLPTELLDTILSFNASQGTLSLWLTGNYAIQRQIALGVTSIHLKNTQEFSMTKLPQFILKLSKLRRLIIDRASKMLYQSNRASSLVRKLPPTLTELRLRYADSAAALAEDEDNNISHWFEPEEDLVTDAYAGDLDDQTPKEGENSRWTLAVAFPKLSVLEISNLSGLNLPTLPPSLTDLTTTLPPPQFDLKHFFQSLPRQLLRLELTKSPRFLEPCVWQYLPPGLQTYVSAVEEDDVDSPPFGHLRLPASLTELRTDSFIADSESMACLPPTITTISDIFHGEFDAYAKLISLLPNLRTLDAYYLSMDLANASFMRSLPSTLTSLRITVNLEEISADDWPKSLVALRLSPDSENFRIEAIPPNLTILDTRKSLIITPSDMALLPQSLTDLRCFVPKIVEEWTSFPPRLKSLKITALKDNIVLERQMIEFEYTDALKRDFTVPGKYLGEDGKTVSMPFDVATFPHLRRFLGGERALKCFPFEMLPRTLATFQTSAILPFSKLHLLPPRLKYLELGSIFRDADCHTQDVAAMRQIMLIGQEEGVVENFDFSQLHHATVSSMLPRTLTDLSFMLVGDRNADDWMHLPPNLTELRCAPMDVNQHLDSASLLAVLKLNLVDISLNVHTLTDEHCKAMPRSLKHARFRCPNLSQLTSYGAFYAPPCAEIVVSNDLAPGFMAARAKRRRYLVSVSSKAEQSPTFEKVLNAHENIDYCHKFLGIDSIKAHKDDGIVQWQ